MLNLSEIVAKGEEIRIALGKVRGNNITDYLKNEVQQWQNLCALYIDGIQIKKETRGRINYAILNLVYNSRINIQHYDELLNFMKACQLQTPETQKSNKKNHFHKSTKVFIVHGHDVQLRTKVENVLMKLGLDPIILAQQSNDGDTVIEKFERISSEADYAIILLTADDKGKPKTSKKYELRARQNVIFEMGYFRAKLGKKNVCYMYEEKVELPSDVKGVAYVAIKQDEKWQFELVKELQNCGFDVSADNL